MTSCSGLLLNSKVYYGCTRSLTGRDRFDNFYNEKNEKKPIDYNFGLEDYIV